MSLCVEAMSLLYLGGEANTPREGGFSDMSEFEQVLVDCQGPLRVVLEFVGAGGELCMALTSRRLLTVLSQKRMTEDSSGGIGAVSGMTIAALKARLRALGISVSGPRGRLVSTLTLRLMARALPHRSKWYFMSTDSLVTFAHGRLGLLWKYTTNTQLRLLLNRAAERGLLPGVKLITNKVKWCWDTYVAATRTGQLEVLMYLRTRLARPQWVKHVPMTAARSGLHKVLRFLRRPHDACPWGPETCRAAAAGRHWELLRWLRRPQDRCPWDETTMSYIAASGDMGVLLWSRSGEDPCPFSSFGWTCYHAASGGHLEMLKVLTYPLLPYIRTHTPSTENITLVSPRHYQHQHHRHLPHSSQWLRTQGCQWNMHTTTVAAQEGHWATLQWLRSQQRACPWQKWLCRDVAQSAGHSEMCAWIDSQPT